MKKQQSGSVISFVVIGVLLTVFAIGGIVVLQQRSAYRAGTAEVSEVSTKVEEQSSSQKKSAEDTQKEAVDKAKDTTTEEQEKSESKKRQEEEAKKEAAKEEVAKKEEASQEVAENGPMAHIGSDNLHADTLPETGPVEDFLMMTIGLFAIAGSGYVYYHFGYGRK